MIKVDRLKKLAREEKIEIEDVMIYHDSTKKMFSLRIPVKIARMANVKDKSIFRFKITSKFLEKERRLKTKLTGELIDG